MIRVFKQYYPIRNIFFVIGEGLVIYLSVFTAAYALRNTEPFVPDSTMALKMLLATLVCQICLYYGDLIRHEHLKKLGRAVHSTAAGIGCGGYFVGDYLFYLS